MYANMKLPEHKRIQKEKVSRDMSWVDDMPETEDENPSHIAPEYIHIDFKTRPSFINKVARINYLILYSLFAAVWFYFIPFTSIYISYAVPMHYGKAFTAYTSLEWGAEDVAAAPDSVDPDAVVDPTS